MSLTDNVAIPRKTMVLFFVVDTSGSMEGSKIGAVNSAIEEVIPELKNLSDANADAQIKIAVLEFSSGARWLTPNGPVEAENYVWRDIDASGVTDLGDACLKLNEKLSTKGFMQEATGSFAPAIFLMSDGAPTDDYKTGLDKLKQNAWFKKAIKVSVAIGDDADSGVLSEFTGSSESVVTVHNVATLKKMIKFVSVRASEVSSKNANVGSTEGGDSKQSAFIDELNNFKVETAASADAGGGDEWA
ncbi:MAG: VWA domain-containing protein [Kiritimatiellaeota bacterium]|nr:VWA domain-containing protein [Kiritimatiellota bacterium]